MSHDRTHRVVVVGAGFGGLAATRALSRRKDVHVTLVDRTNHHLFQPLLYQVASAALSPSEIASPTRAVLRGRRNVTVLLGEMTGVDYASRTVELDHGQATLPYDFLVLALGGRTSYFGHDEWQRHATGLKSLHDAVRIRNQVLSAFERAEREPDPEARRRLMTFAIVGGGPTGVELAGAFAELRRHVLRWDFQGIDPAAARIVLIEGGGSLLGPFAEPLRENARRRLEALGVEVRLNERVLDITEGTVTTDQATLHAETILWAAGVAGADLAPRLGTPDRAGRLQTQPDLRLHDRVYCLGDMAHLEQDGRPLPQVAPVAMQQGRHAARNILLQIQGKPTLPFRYFDKGSMATVGRSAAVAQVGPLHVTGLPAWGMWLFVHLMFLVDFQVRVLVLMRWAWAYFTWKWGVRLITEGRSAGEKRPEGDAKDGRVVAGAAPDGGGGAGREGLPGLLLPHGVGGGAVRAQPGS